MSNFPEQDSGEWVDCESDEAHGKQIDLPSSSPEDGQPKMSNFPEQDSDEWVDCESDEAPSEVHDVQIDLPRSSPEDGQVNPSQIDRRVRALKQLLVQFMHIEESMFMEMHKLVCSYHQLLTELYNRRRAIVNGESEPTEDEYDSKWDSLLDASFEDLSSIDITTSEIALHTKGVPFFWVTALKNAPFVEGMIFPQDEPILEHLIDVKVDYIENEPMGFILSFVFEPNEYFSNSVLTKAYEVKNKVDEADPFSYEGPEIVKCEGCTIDWSSVDKNVTRKIITVKQRHGLFGTRMVQKRVKAESFFNFFQPPQVFDQNRFDEETHNYLLDDYGVAVFMRERLIPRAVLYYTGEADEEEYIDERDGEEAGGGQRLDTGRTAKNEADDLIPGDNK